MIMTRSNIVMMINGICTQAAPRRKKRMTYIQRHEEGSYRNEDIRKVGNAEIQKHAINPTTVGVSKGSCPELS